MKAVCFDLDGTICDLWEGEHKARDILIDRLVEETGHERGSLASTYDAEWAKIKAEYMALVAQGLEEVDIREKHMNTLKTALKTGIDAQGYAELHCQETMNGIYIYPDARDVLKSVGEKYRLCMITNGASKWQREKIEKLDLAEYFEEIIVSGELGHHKPSPRIFNEMTTRMDVQPDEIMYVGNDYRKDIMGADAAGWETAWVNRVHEDIGTVKPTQHIKELSELNL